MYKNERDTDDIFVEPDMYYRKENQEKVRLKSCDELLSLKLPGKEDTEKYILVVGNPGSGKSTIVNNKLAYEWALGRKHSHVSLLFAINMRNIKPGSNLIDIIENQLGLLANAKKDGLEKLIETNSQSIVFLFDGFDSVSLDWEGGLKGLSVVLENKWLQGCHIIVTTRPSKEATFCEYYSDFTVVDLSRLSKVNTSEFVKKFFCIDDKKNKGKMFESFQSTLQTYPRWASWLTTNPLTLSMLCLLFKEGKKLPTSVTSLYVRVIRYLKAHMKGLKTKSGIGSSKNTYDDFDLDEVMKCVGKCALSELCGQKSTFDPNCAEIVYGLQLGICSTETTTDAYFESQTFITFPQHKTFTELFAAVYLVNSIKNDVNEFLSMENKLVTTENLLRFCCGLDHYAASFIIQNIVVQRSLSLSDLPNGDARRLCLSGSGVDRMNPWKLPLVLLFEFETSEWNRDTSGYNVHVKDMHEILEPLVENIQMKCENWPCDAEMITVLAYFRATASAQSWLYFVKKATIIIESCVELTGFDVMNQARLLGCMDNLHELCVMSSPALQRNCTLILANSMSTDSKGCQKLQKLAFSYCNVDIHILNTFLTKQMNSLVAVFDNAQLLENKNRKLSDVAVVCDLRIIDISGKNCEKSLTLLLKMIKSPLKLSITTSKNLSTSEKRECEYYYQTEFRMSTTGSHKQLFTSDSHGYDPSAFRVGFLHLPNVMERKYHVGYDSQWFRFAAILGLSMEENPRSQANEYLPDLSTAFSRLSQFPSGKRTITDLTCAGCVVSLRSLIDLLCMQPIFGITLVNVVIACNPHNLISREYPLVPNSINNVSIAHCEFSLRLLDLFLGVLPPLASLKLHEVSVKETRRSLNFSGSINSAWIFCQYCLQHPNVDQVDESSVAPLVVKSVKGSIIPHCYQTENWRTLNATGPRWGTGISEIINLSDKLKSVTKLTWKVFKNDADLFLQLLEYMPVLIQINIQYIKVTDDADNDSSRLSISGRLFQKILKYMRSMPLLKVVSMEIRDSVIQDGPFIRMKLVISTIEELTLFGFSTEKCRVNLTTVFQILRCLSSTGNLKVKNCTILDGHMAKRVPKMGHKIMSDILLDNCIIGVALYFKILNTLVPNETFKLANSSLVCDIDMYSPIILHGTVSQKLDLSGNRFDSNVAFALARLFQHNQSPSYLYLRRCCIGRAVASALAKTFQQTPALQHLDLRNNSIESDGATALAKSFQHTPNLQHLDLGSNSIGGNGVSALSQSFQHTPALQHLDLTNNSILSHGASALAKSFQHTPELQHFDISDNNIESDGASALAQSLQYTPVLQHLDLSYNSIGSNGASVLSQSFQHTPALQHLDLTNNSILSHEASALAKSFQHTLELQHFDISDNNIGSDGASALAQSLQYTPVLQHLDLSYNSIGSNGASALARSFQHTSALQHLDMSDNNIMSNGASELAKSFQHTPNLKHLDLGNNRIGSNGASALAQSFQHTPALQHLDLSNNSIGSDWASALAKSFQHAPNLQHLDLGNNRIGSNGASALAQSFQHTPALQHLDLSNNNIESDGASSLAYSFHLTPALQHVDLSSNHIESKGASALSQSFQHTPNLQHLDLRYNRIGSNGASALAQSFQHTATLQHLDMSDNYIGLDGASALAQSFQHTPVLKHLDLRNNRIGSNGALAVAQSFQHTPNLQHLDLRYNNIRSDGASALASSFQHTPALQFLDLGSNYIELDGSSALAQSFQRTTALQHLDLRNNRISFDGVSALAKSFENTPALQHLDLSYNHIASDGASVLAKSFQHTPALQHLDLTNNSILSHGASALAKSFQHTPELQHFDISDNNIESDGASSLAQSLQYTPVLQHLDLSYNSIDSNGASALARSFQHTPALQHLDMSDNNIMSNGASELAKSFQHTPNLKHLDLGYNRIGSNGASALAQSFQHTPALQHLDLSNNSIESDGASALAKSFKHAPNLQHLDLGNNRIESNGASALAESFQHTPSLQHLDLSNNSIESDGASPLAYSFQHTPALQHVDLSSNHIESKGASALSQSFQHTPNLQHLDLRYNRIGSNGASALAQSFQHTATLQHLDMSDNYIGLDGALALAQSFQHTPALKHLDLRNNRIGSHGALAVAQSFQHTPNLQHLDLRYNNIQSDGASALASYFQHTPALQFLYLGSNYIELDGSSALAKSFQLTPALQHLDLRNNRISFDGVSALAKSFKNTPALQHLDLSYNHIESDGASVLAKSFLYTPALQHLNLGDNNIGSNGASALAKSFQYTPNLQYVNLSCNNVSDRASALAKHSNTLQNCRILT